MSNLVNIRIINKDANHKILSKKCKQFVKGCQKMLERHAVGLCYDLIRVTAPLTKDDPTSGGSMKAYEQGMTNYHETINSAFKPITALPLGQFIVNQDIQSIRAYLKIGDRFFDNERYQKWLDEGNYLPLRYALMQAGTYQEKDLTVIDDASLDWLNWWKINQRDYHKYRQSSSSNPNPYYVRNRESIQQLHNAGKRLKIGHMAGGWLQCAIILGKECDKWTNVMMPIWMYGKGVGYVKKGKLSVIVSNPFANYGNWMKEEYPQIMLNQRKYKLAKSAVSLTQALVKMNAKEELVPDQ